MHFDILYKKSTGHTCNLVSRLFIYSWYQLWSLPVLIVNQIHTYVHIHAEQIQCHIYHSWYLFIYILIQTNVERYSPMAGIELREGKAVCWPLMHIRKESSTDRAMAFSNVVHPRFLSLAKAFYTSTAIFQSRTKMWFLYKNCTKTYSVWSINPPPSP